MGAKGPAGIAFHTLVEAGMVLAVAVGASLLLGARVDPAVFVALSLMAVRFADPVGMLAFYVDPVHEAGVALESIGSILDAPVMSEPAPGEESLPGAPYDVVLDGVSFGYTPEREVIHDASLSFPAGGVAAAGITVAITSPLTRQFDLNAPTVVGIIASVIALLVMGLFFVRDYRRLTPMTPVSQK